MEQPAPIQTSSRRKMAVLLGLGFASGVPLLLTGRTMRVWARDQGVDLESIGLMGLVTLPYAYKFLWAPMLDTVSPGLFGRRRGWVLIFQVLLGIAIVTMGIAGPALEQAGGLRTFVLLAAAVAFLSASHDIVADAYRTDILRSSELGPGASVFTTGYRLAMLAAGAGAVWLASFIPWKDVYAIAGWMMLIGIVATVFAPTPTDAKRAPRSLADALIGPTRDLMRRNGARAALLVLLFIFLFKLPDYMAASLTDVMLLDLGYSMQVISVWSLGVGTAVTIPGALVGGALVPRFGLKRSLIIFGIAQAVSNAGYLSLALLESPCEWLMIIVVGVEYFCAGLVAAGFIAFLMSQCNHRYSATQYALLSSLMGLSNSLAGIPSGYFAEHFRYPAFLMFTIAAAIPGVMLIPLLPWKRPAGNAKCPACGYDLQANLSGKCPECGVLMIASAADARPSV